MNDEGLRRTYQELIARRGAQDRSRCPPSERLHELVTRSGPEDARLAVANHVMACPHCLPEFELLRSVNEGLPEPRPARRWVALAASVALLVVAGIVGRQLLQSRGDTLRAGPAIQLIAPGEGRVLSNPVRFTWSRVPDAVQYQIQILTPEGNQAYQTTTPDTTLIVDALGPGQFLWQVSAKYAAGEPLRSRPIRFSIRTP